MNSARSLKSRLKNRRLSSNKKEDDEDLNESSQSSLSSRPSTQESKRSSCSRLSTDSGAGSLDDFNNRRNSSPDYWRDSLGRRHTAPIRKLLLEDEDAARPNTVHVWDACSTRCSLSRYAPLPAIGVQQEQLRTRTFERPGPVRRQCFMGPLDIDSTEDNDVNDNESATETRDGTNPPPVFSLSLESETDSDFDEDSEGVNQCVSDNDETDDRQKRPLIRSATFTIEKERPIVRGPFLTVAVRLPDGKRVAERFDCKDMLQTVCGFALDKMEGLRPPKYSLVTTDIPKRTFKDLTISLKDAGIDDKTLLYLQEIDDSDSE